jgi:hypothetical protein
LFTVCEEINMQILLHQTKMNQSKRWFRREKISLCRRFLEGVRCKCTVPESI